MMRFRTIDIVAVLSRRILNCSDYDFDRLIYYISGSDMWSDLDLKITQMDLIKQFPEINKIVLKMEKNYKKCIDNNNYSSCLKPIEWAKQEVVKKYGEWINVKSPYGNRFYKDLDPSLSYPFLTKDSNGFEYWEYPEVIQFPKKDI